MPNQFHLQSNSRPISSPEREVAQSLGSSTPTWPDLEPASVVLRRSVGADLAEVEVEVNLEVEVERAACDSTRTGGSLRNCYRCCACADTVVVVLAAA